MTHNIKEHARQLGFDFCRITPVTAAPHADFFEEWLAQGRAGEMGYLARHTEKRRNPARLAETDASVGQASANQASASQEVSPYRSMLVLGVNYHQFDLPPHLRDDPSRGIIAAYAWGDDYHEIIRPLLYDLDAFIRSQTGRSTPGKCLVDTGPVLERDWASRAGMGFTGKNCCTIVPGAGSWLFLAVVLIPEVPAYDPSPRAVTASKPAPELPPQAVLQGLDPRGNYGTWKLASDDAASTKTGTCGHCTRCLVACPTDAFTGPFHLDPQRCISYWTIEARSPIPRELRPFFGNRIFGCDICQEVCPWNQRLPERTPLLEALHAQAGRVAIPLLEGFAPETPYWLVQDAFNARFRRSPIRRAKRAGMLRNVCVALGNWAHPDVVPALQQALADPEPLARGHAAWALGQLLPRQRHAPARAALEDALLSETDAWVQEEIRMALETSNSL